AGYLRPTPFRHTGPRTAMPRTARLRIPSSTRHRSASAHRQGPGRGVRHTARPRHPGRRRVVRLRDPQTRQRALRRAHGVDRRHALPPAPPARAARLREVVVGHLRRGAPAQALRDHRHGPRGARRAAAAVGRRLRGAQAGLAGRAAGPGGRGGVGLMTEQNAHAALEEQIDQWRAYVQRRRAISAADVDEMEDHLRGQVADLAAGGLDDDEAFLVAVKRMGNLDDVSREFAREHSDRLWKQLVLVPEEPGGTGRWRELGVVLALAVAAGIWVRILVDASGGDDAVVVRNAVFAVLPFLAGYFAWKRRLTWRLSATLLAVTAAPALVVNLYPFEQGAYGEPGMTELLAVTHTPVVLWLLLGVV